MVGLADQGDRYPHELSGGERQRVALARALAPHPKLMLLDEPFASLDPNLRTQIRADVVELLHQAGTAAVFVTHDQAEALSVGDRIAVIRAGRIEQVGTPDDVFHRPANRFVAGFMGQACFLELDASGATEMGPVRTYQSPVAGTAIVVRPNDVLMHFGESAPPAAVEAKVVGAEFRGTTREYQLRLPSGTLLDSSQDHTVVLHPGDSVKVSLADEPFTAVRSEPS
jgi:iron(III) transport system ATP-binding protein